MIPTTSPWVRVSSIVGGAIAFSAGVVLFRDPLTALSILVWFLACALLVAAGAVHRLWPGKGRVWWASAALLAGAAAVAILNLRILDAVPAILCLGAALNALRLLVGMARRSGERAIRALWAASNTLAAILVWLWPDAAMLILAWSFAVALMIAGIGVAWRAGRGQLNRLGHRPKRRRRRFLPSLVAATVACASTIASVWMVASVANPGEFYAWPSQMPERPGVLLRAEPYSGDVPAGAHAERIVYTTSHTDGTIALASAVVAIPDAAAEEDRLILAWQHGTTGVAQACAPSLRTDALSETAIPGISQMVQRGWLVVATDYPGQGTAGRYPYLIGEGEGRATLDAVRAVQQMKEAHASDRTMLWGHSQGGHATLWAGQMAPEYAPELDIIAVAALSAAADPLAMARRVTQSASGPLNSIITSYVLIPYADEYPDISLADQIHPAGEVFAQAAASRCVTDRSMLVTFLVGLGLGDRSDLYRLDVESGPVHDRLSQNTANGRLAAPLFLGQGLDDEVVPIQIQRDLSTKACTAGGAVVAHEYPDRSHMGVIAEDSPLIDDLFSWTDDVLAGTSPSSCTE